MQVEDGKIEGSITIEQDFQLNGVIAGNATVKAGAFLQLNGVVTGDIILEPSSSVEINGTVNGNVLNKGGKLDVFGVVLGSVSGNANIDGNAVIRG